MMLLYPTKSPSEAKMALLYPTKSPSEAKMVLLYPTKSPRRQKWHYCTLQNRRGGKNGATVPYSNAAEIKMTLLNCSKPSGRSK